MSNYILTEEADEDLRGIWDYIAQDDIEAADRWDAKLRDAFGMLAGNPRAGHAQ
jgi:plasmid stabilization system protein ParE